jgi:SAM-dependent methyltransferase
MLARKLSGRCASVTGIDADERMIDVARELGRGVPGVSFIRDDFLSHPFAAAGFDFACANTSLHHMDFAAALEKMAGILRPGGRLAVVGLARNGSPADWVIGGAGIPANVYYRRVRGEGYPGAPVKEPDMTWSEVRRTAARVLPGSRYRRHLLWRYSIVWAKPA